MPAAIEKKKENKNIVKKCLLKKYGLIEMNDVGTVRPVNTDTEGGIENVCINGVSVLVVQILEKM